MKNKTTVSATKRYFTTESAAKNQAKRLGRNVLKIAAKNYYVGTSSEISKLEDRIVRAKIVSSKKDLSRKAKTPFRNTKRGDGDVGLPKKYTTKKGKTKKGQY